MPSNLSWIGNSTIGHQESNRSYSFLLYFIWSGYALKSLFGLSESMRPVENSFFRSTKFKSCQALKVSTIIMNSTTRLNGRQQISKIHVIQPLWPISVKILVSTFRTSLNFQTIFNGSHTFTAKYTMHIYSDLIQRLSKLSSQQWQEARIMQKQL